VRILCLVLRDSAIVESVDETDFRIPSTGAENKENKMTVTKIRNFVMTMILAVALPSCAKRVSAPSPDEPPVTTVPGEQSPQPTAQDGENGRKVDVDVDVGGRGVGVDVGENGVKVDAGADGVNIDVGDDTPG
jgi:hypothetical protein